MLALFASLKSNIPFGKKIGSAQAEGVVNRLHYRATVIVFLGSCLLVTCLEWVGNGSKISCVMEGASDDWTIPPNVINTYCFVMTTFTLPQHYHSKIGYEAASAGVGAYNPHTDEVTYKAYYQWVPFVLFLQGVMFYVPHLIFKSWEGGKVQGIVAGLNQLIMDKRDRVEKEKVLAQYVVDSLNTHNFWAFKMLVIELLNLINVVGNIFFLDVFLGGEFSAYGIEVVKFLESDPEVRIDPMATVFPRVTKCSYFKYGPSGTVQTHDAICVLPINIMNEKIFVFVWFWLVVLSGVTVVSLFYHVFVMMTPAITKMYLRTRALHQKGVHLDEIGKRCEVGDWKLLYLLAKNMEPVVFGEFLRELYTAMGGDKLLNDRSKKQLLRT